MIRSSACQPQADQFPALSGRHGDCRSYTTRRDTILNQIVCPLKFFCGITLGQNDVPERIPYARKSRAIPVVLSADEVVQFLEAVSSLKARVALTCPYPAGLRVGEVCGLKVHDIYSSRMVIPVRHGKGRKARYVMLSVESLGILRSYWRLARPESFLFPGPDPGKPIEPTVLNAACRSAVTATGLSKRVTVHTLRHSFATHLLENGTDIRIIQVLLGHAHLSSKAHYMQVSNKTICSTTSPLDRLRLEVTPPGYYSGALCLRSRRHLAATWGVLQTRERRSSRLRRTSRHGCGRSLPDAAARRSRRYLRRL
jgi:integrase